MVRKLEKCSKINAPNFIVRPFRNFQFRSVNMSAWSQVLNILKLILQKQIHHITSHHIFTLICLKCHVISINFSFSLLNRLGTNTRNNADYFLHLLRVSSAHRWCHANIGRLVTWIALFEICLSFIQCCFACCNLNPHRKAYEFSNDV